MYEYGVDLIKNIRHYFNEMEYLVVAAIFGIVNALIRPAKTSIGLYLIEFTISVTTATLVGFIMMDLGASKSLSYLSTAISAILARDILTLIVGFGTFTTNNKDALYNVLFKKVLQKLKGEEVKKDGKRKKVQGRGRRVR